MSGGTKEVRVWLDEDLVKQIRAIAVLEDTTAATLFEIAVKEYLASREAKVLKKGNGVLKEFKK